MDLVQYLEPHALVSQIIEKLELVYGTITFFNMLMQNFHHLQQEKTERVQVFNTKLEKSLHMA